MRFGTYTYTLPWRAKKPGEVRFPDAGPPLAALPRAAGGSGDTTPTRGLAGLASRTAERRGGIVSAKQRHHSQLD